MYVLDYVQYILDLIKFDQVCIMYNDSIMYTSSYSIEYSIDGMQCSVLQYYFFVFGFGLVLCTMKCADDSLFGTTQVDKKDSRSDEK